MSKLSQAENIRRYMRKYPNKTVSEVAKVAGVRYQVAYAIRKKMDAKEENPKAPKWVLTHVSASGSNEKTEMPPTTQEPAPDLVNHPAHYKVGGIETIDFIEAKGLNYRLGNAVKYITRADYKGNRRQDLEKAVWYLQRELSKMQEA